MTGPSSPSKRTSDRLGLDAGAVQHGAERHALPARIAHQPVAGLTAGHARLEETATIAGALADRHQLDRVHALQLHQFELQDAVLTAPVTASRNSAGSISSGMLPRW